MAISFNATAITSAITNSEDLDRQENSVVVFNNEEYGQIRVVMRGDAPWFVAKDVCACLDLTDTSKTVSLLDDDERGTNTIRTPSGWQEMLIVSEPGLYSLILRSRKPEARAFKRWVTHEVLPSIRKSGSFSFAPKPTAQDTLTALLSNPRALGELLIDYADTKERLAIETARADEAVRTKAEIGSRREATAMATASVAVRQNAKLTEANAVLSAENADLKDERGRGENFKAVTNIPWIKQIFDVAVKGAWSQIGRALSKMTKALGLEPRKVPGEKYDVQSYPLQAIEEFKRKVDEDPTYLANYRIG